MFENGGGRKIAEQDIIYRIDGRDVLIFVNEEWDRFAEANDGEGAKSAHVLGRPLWDFISDMTTQEIYRQIMQRVRNGHLVSFTFRCDSPRSRRVLRMDIYRGEGEDVEFHTHTLAEEQREPVQLKPAQGEVTELLRVCSWCKRVHVEDSWEEIEAALERLRLFQMPRPPLITHGICEECYQRMLGVLAQP
mgnify:CR=1 FL=1